MNHSGRRILVAVALVAQLAPPSTGFAQADRVGVVTTLEGTAVVARASVSAPLKFKDSVFVHDRISTGERSFIRVLLGGKATVTARERSVIVITEAPGTSTLALASGRIAVAVSKEKMKPGEVIQISTPNALATIRGTIVVAEVSPAWTGTRSVITVLRGLIDVTRIDPTTGRTMGAARDVGALQTITVTGASPAPLPQPAAISTQRAKRLSSEFTVVPKNPPAGSTEPLVSAAVQGAAADIKAMLASPETKASGDRGHAANAAVRNGSGTGNSSANGGEASSGSASAVAGPANGNGLAVGNGGGNGLTLGNSGGNGLALGNGGGNGLALGNGVGNGVALGNPGKGGGAIPPGLINNPGKGGPKR